MVSMYLCLVFIQSTALRSRSFWRHKPRHGKLCFERQAHPETFQAIELWKNSPVWLYSKTCLKWPHFRVKPLALCGTWYVIGTSFSRYSTVSPNLHWTPALPIRYLQSFHYCTHYKESHVSNHMTSKPSHQHCDSLSSIV